jgi:hypothetical protein
VQLEGLGQLKNPNDLIRNQTRDLPACSIVSQPTTLPQALFVKWHLKDMFPRLWPSRISLVAVAKYLSQAVQLSELTFLLLLINKLQTIINKGNQLRFQLASISAI